MLDKRDAVIAAQCPVVIAPKYGELEPLEVGQRRYVLASNALYIEAKSSVLYVRQRIQAITEGVAYAGHVSEFLTVSKPVPNGLFNRMIEMAEDAEPQEMAALVVADDEGHYQLVAPEIDSASPAHVTYTDLSLEQEDRLLLDVHSHGRGRAYFSATDDASDRSRRGPHISVVFGRCHDRVRYVARVCIGQHLIGLTKPLQAMGVIA
jgi:PRTRC genetic system protein A